MDRTRETLRAARAIIATVVAVLVAAGCGSGASERSAPAAAGHVPRHVGDSPRKHVAARPTLALYHRGHPTVWVRKGQHVVLRTAPHGRAVRTVGHKTEFGEVRVFSVVQRRGDWVGVPTPYLANDQLAWLRLDPRRLKAGWTPYSILVDLSARRAELLHGHHVVRAFSVTVGSPGTDTPTGRFAVTDEFHGTLDRAAYGCCALALTARQPHIPSGWLGGDRIAIHGTPGPVGEALSHGCIRALDPDVYALWKTVPLGAPVVVQQ